MESPTPTGSSSTQPPPRRKSTGKHKKPDYFGKYTMTPRRKHKAKVILISITTSDKPTIQEAMQATPAEMEFLNKAIDVVISTLCAEETWTEVQDREGNIKALPSHIVLKIKRNKHGQAKNSRPEWWPEVTKWCTNAITNRSMTLLSISLFVFWFSSFRL